MLINIVDIYDLYFIQLSRFILPSAIALTLGRRPMGETGEA